MRRLLFVLAALCTTLLIAAPAQADGYRAPRTPWGAPDLQGLWTNLSLTSLERPDGVKPLVLSDAAAKAFETAQAAERLHPEGDKLGQRSSEMWPDAPLGRIAGQARSSWIVDPVDGQIPYAPGGKARLATQQARGKRFNNPEDRPGSERCLEASWGATGPPMLNSNYSANYQIVQTVDTVAILSEMNHDVRLVRMNGSHPPAAMRLWMGDSVGHWEGQTLVVETTNRRAEDSMSAWGLLLGADTTVIERFTRTAPGEILYQFSVVDPSLYTQVWRGEMPLLATKGPMLEFACHEGNYSLPGVLAGARQAEAKAAAK